MLATVAMVLHTVHVQYMWYMCTHLTFMKMKDTIVFNLLYMYNIYIIIYYIYNIYIHSP